jgi:hypothetical protein
VNMYVVRLFHYLEKPVASFCTIEIIRSIPWRWISKYFRNGIYLSNYMLSSLTRHQSQKETTYFNFKYAIWVMSIFKHKYNLLWNTAVI